MLWKLVGEGTFVDYVKIVVCLLDDERKPWCPRPRIRHRGAVRSPGGRGPQSSSSMAAVLADAQERNAAFPSLHPAPLRPYRIRPGCLRTKHDRRRGHSSAPGSRSLRRCESYGYTHALPEFARDAFSFASLSLRWHVRQRGRRCPVAGWWRGRGEK